MENSLIQYYHVRRHNMHAVSSWMLDLDFTLCNMVLPVSKDNLEGQKSSDNKGHCRIRTIYYSHSVVTQGAKGHVTHPPQKELNIVINMGPHLVNSIKK